MRRNRWIVATVETDENSRAKLVVLERCRTRQEADETFAEGGPCYGMMEAGVAFIPRRSSSRTGHWPRWIDVVLRQRFAGQPAPTGDQERKIGHPVL